MIGFVCVMLLLLLLSEYKVLEKILLIITDSLKHFDFSVSFYFHLNVITSQND